MDDLKTLHESRKAGHELRDAYSVGLMWVGIAFMVGAILMHVVLATFFFKMRGYLRSTRFRTTPLEQVEARTPPPPPRLQSNPRTDLRAFLKSEDERLSGYGWIDPAQGTVRIPIERAIDLRLSEAARGASR